MELERKKKFNSYAILDLETATLPHLNRNKVGISEITIYGIGIEAFDKKHGSGKLVDLPRVVHKLTMMTNPRMAIDPYVEGNTGLSNEMLEHESSFDENAVGTVLGFLNHLRQPICLVAHNGYKFDFPIMKRVFEKVEMTMPDTLYCIDSLRAFHDIDLENLGKLKNGPSTSSSMNMSYLVPEGKPWYPPRDIYKLGRIYLRTFGETAPQHHAEADVIVLTKLMLHFGKDFVDYVENHARQFISIPRVVE